MKPLCFLAILLAPGLALADVTSPADAGRVASFDILSAKVTRTDATLTFRMATAGTAGVDTPAPIGALAGAPVHAYVWPTSLDPATVGFEPATGILALAATSHPDFDDTPLYDENGDGDPANDGLDWHSHWVVLVPSEDCGPGALAVRDIPEGATPRLPKTWPGLPLFIDSPDVTPVFDGPVVSVAIEVQGAEGASFDGVTSALRVNANLHAPLLCVTDVFDIASGDLSLPGRID
ncbi:hypothetical protein [Tabrizicola sp.]|uniref:hypothetical protein n=1 Tax=Tabrizicola sp. TaxID=2005166 RepID=UPI002734DC99|nr:hypothetical protein [Tabrizicola sp.]MDP3197564.1 hypothetical protein [Tabrizicola sp.]